MVPVDCNQATAPIDLCTHRLKVSQWCLRTGKSQNYNCMWQSSRVGPHPATNVRTCGPPGRDALLTMLDSAPAGSPTHRSCSFPADGQAACADFAHGLRSGELQRKHGKPETLIKSIPTTANDRRAHLTQIQQQNGSEPDSRHRPAIFYSRWRRPAGRSRCGASSVGTSRGGSLATA